MKTIEVLNDFHKYIGYDPEQSRFNLLSNDWAFHDAGKKIEELLSGYDPDGVISVMFAREAFLKAADNCRINLHSYLTKQEVRDDVKRDEEMYRKLTDPEILEAENAYMEEMNELVVQAAGKPLIGNRDIEAEREIFSGSVLKVVENLKKCRIDVFRKVGSIGKIEKFTTRILLFERMADCLLYLEKAPDAMYFCYINQYGSADGYFSFLVKSEGNIVSICDRVPETYIGMHGNSRNGRWTEDKALGIFPYNYIFHYSEYDYKGYASKYEIDDEKLEFMNLPAEVYQPILVAMILLRNKWQGKTVESEPLYLNTLMEEYYLEEHPGTELMVLKDSSIAERHESYNPSLKLEEVMDGTLNRKFKMNEPRNLWVQLYGEGFQPDYDAILSPAKPEYLLTDKEKPEFYAEFIGTKDDMDREVYRKIRVQLAEYIHKKMKVEYEAFGGEEHVLRYWTECAKGKKETLVDAFCQRQYYYDHPEEMPKKEVSGRGSFASLYSTDADDIQFRIRKYENSDRPSGICLNNDGIYCHRYLENALDDMTGKKCSIYFQVQFRNWNELEDLAGEPLPRIFIGWTSNGELGYNGNSILDATDAVGELTSPLYAGRGWNEYGRCDFTLWMGFSKTGWKKVYENWLLKNGLESEIERKKEEKKKKKEEEKKNALALLAEPYEPSEFIQTYSNSDVLEEIERELDSVIPGARIGSMGLGKENSIYSVSAAVRKKGNKEKIEKLCSLGWRKQYEHRSGGTYYVKLSREVPGKEQ